MIACDPFAALNDAQRAAVEHGVERPGCRGQALLVIAGAGSGKTMTLAITSSASLRHPGPSMPCSTAARWASLSAAKGSRAVID